MRHYVIYEKETGNTSERWIYLTGVLLSDGKVVQTIENFKIREFELEFEKEEDRFFCETKTSNVFVIGKCVSNKKIIAKVMFDDPDVTGIGVVSLNGIINKETSGEYIQVPFPFAYLPLKKRKVEQSYTRSVCPLVVYDGKGTAFLNSFESELDAVVSRFEFSFRNAYGFDEKAPALYICENRGGVRMRKTPDGNVVNFLAVQVCRR